MAERTVDPPIEGCPPRHMFNPNELDIRSFQPEDQDAVKALVLEGLGERWGAIDPTKNPDLTDIAASYAGGFFRVAEINGRIIGTGALIPRGAGVSEIRRMSVERGFRRRGIGGAILRRLIEDARTSGCRRIILETTSTWQDAAAFYRKHGFRVTHHQGGDTYFLLELNPGPSSVV
jgi:GNAT superfamily N-acetyltransferase